ncbi:MAG: TRAP transporter substrate-binding protein DctP [Aquisalimonadaceae bacterium]
MSQDHDRAKTKGGVSAGAAPESGKRDVSRRDFLRIASRYGMTATLGAAAVLGGSYSAGALAQTAGRLADQRARNTPKHKLRLGMVYTDGQHDIQRVGVWDFVRDIEARTDGAIQIEVLDSGGVCAETTCAQQALQGVIDITVNSTQNGASVAPWLNALDFPYMFQSPGQIYDFVFNPESERLFRKPYRERHNLEMLFTTAELRGVLMGSEFSDKPAVTSLDQLNNARIRATATQFGQIALRLLGMRPVPVAWGETLDALRSGLVDGMETWAGAAAAFNMAPAVTKYVGLNFIPGTEHTAINIRTLDKLDADGLRDAVMESAYQTQQVVMYNFSAARHYIIGDVPNPGPETIYGKSGTEMNFLSSEVLAEAEEIAHPDKPEYEQLRNRLNEMAGFDVYKEMLPVAQRFPKDELEINVVPRRWWLPA